MDCRTASLLIEAYHDDELPLVDAAQLLAHLDECPSCDRRCEEAACLRETMRSQRPVDRCPEELVRRLARRVDLPNRSRRHSLRPALFALVGGCGLLVGWVGGRSFLPPGHGLLAFAPAHRTFVADVFCLRCALKALLGSGAGETGPHRPILRTADGKFWVVRPDSAAQALFRETGPGPRHVVVTATLDERTGLADVSAVTDEFGGLPASR